MTQRKSPLGRGLRRQGRQKKCACAFSLPLPLRPVNASDLGPMLRLASRLIDRVAAAGWPWCPAASQFIDVVQDGVDRAMDEAQAGRWAQ
jgi:hypothetical protein